MTMHFQPKTKMDAVKNYLAVPPPLSPMGFQLRGEGVSPNFAKENSAKTGILGRKTLFFAFFHTFSALFCLLYGLFGPFLTLFNTKTPFLVLLENCEKFALNLNLNCWPCSHCSHCSQLCN